MSTGAPARRGHGNFGGDAVQGLSSEILLTESGDVERSRSGLATLRRRPL